MIRPALALLFVATVLSVAGAPAPPAEKAAPVPHFDYQIAKEHELKPHRRTIPTKGATGGFSQLHIILTISPTGDVSGAQPGDDFREPGSMNSKLFRDFWPKVRDEVYGWKFTPFEANGHPAAAEIEEYVDLVPPERLPKNHVPPPTLRPDSAIAITLQRTGCYGTCPAYSVTLANGGITFDGHGFVIAQGKHTASLDQEAFRALAQKFVKSDLYSMEDKYVAGVTDCATYRLFISIDGKSKAVTDYMGTWVGMPAVIKELEDEVDELAQTSRWIDGTDGLVPALEAEHYNFKSYEAQVILKAAARKGLSSTVEDLLEAGVPIQPLPAPKASSPSYGVPFEHVGWLASASNDAATLQILIDNQLSHDDQSDKDLALLSAASLGNLATVRLLIDYGANPNADLSKLSVPLSGRPVSGAMPGSGSILIHAASSGNPEVIREILTYHPSLETRDRNGRTALFVIGESRNQSEDRLSESVRLLVAAGADVNARDNDGNTPLHTTLYEAVAAALVHLGANVNARNKDGDTPIFHTFDDNTTRLLIAHGADLSIRNKTGKNVVEASADFDPQRIEILKEALRAQSENTQPAQPQ